MHRIAIIGAGSVNHSKRLINDLFSLPVTDGATLVLMSPHEERVAVVARYAHRVVDATGRKATIETTVNYQEALREANVVYLLYDYGGFDAYKRDYEISRRYGIDVCIGDTMNPTGIMKACRNIVLLKDIATEINATCPDALVINYVNPMAAMTLAAREYRITNWIGICGGIEATRKIIAHCLELPVNIIQIEFAGINHMCWAVSIRSEDRDLYPQFRRNMATPGWIAAEPVRYEMLQSFGYFVTETSGHLADMFPWFRRDERTRAIYCQGQGYSGMSGAYLRYGEYVHKRLTDVDYLWFERGDLEPISDDYGARIANAWMLGGDYTCYGNIVNDKQVIENLPITSAVEVPVTVGHSTLSMCTSIKLPITLAALCGSNILAQRLTVRASIDGNTETLFAAMSLDPLTGATLTLSDIRQLTKELIATNREWFPEGAFAELDMTLDVAQHINAKPIHVPGEHLLRIVRRYDRATRSAAGKDGRPNPS